jgi:hypothetical membrane protein
MPITVHRTNFLFGLLACIGIAQFLGATHVAIRSYPASADGTESGYELTGHFLSDLGSTKTTDGLPNSNSAILFNSSVMGLGISLAPFLCVLASHCGRLAWLAGGCGALSSVGLVGIGLTPYDVYFTAHHIALGLWLGPMLVCMVLYFTSAAFREEASVSLWCATSLVVIAALGYASIGSRDGYVVMQKLLSVMSIVWFLLVFASVSFATWQSIPLRKTLVDRQAEQFVGVLRHGYRKPIRRDEHT